MLRALFIIAQSQIPFGCSMDELAYPRNGKLIHERVELGILTMTRMSPQCVRLRQGQAYIFSDSIYMTFFKKQNYGDRKQISSCQGWA